MVKARPGGNSPRDVRKAQGDEVPDNDCYGLEYMCGQFLNWPGRHCDGLVSRVEKLLAVPGLGRLGGILASLAFRRGNAAGNHGSVKPGLHLPIPLTLRALIDMKFNRMTGHSGSLLWSHRPPMGFDREREGGRSPHVHGIPADPRPAFAEAANARFQESFQSPKHNRRRTTFGGRLSCRVASAE